MAKKGIDAAILVIIVVVIAAASAIGGYYLGTHDVGESKNQPSGMMTVHAPIFIYGNSGFTRPDPVNGGGSGTKNDPYIIENWFVGANSEYGIRVYSTTAYFIIRNCIVENILSKNYQLNYDDGIDLTNVVNGEVENCACDNNLAGIAVGSSSSIVIMNNTCNNNGVGITVGKLSSTIIMNNTCDNNGSFAIGLNECSTTYLVNNTCSNNHDESGIFMSSSSFNILTNNWCSNNFTGISLYSSTNNTLTNNTCENNFLAGIVLYYGGLSQTHSDNNLIYHNNLINNTTQATDDSSNYWSNGYPSGGNYWSNYTGADNYSGPDQNFPGPDGIGDTQYKIPEGSNQDRYPLMNPI